MRLLLIAAFVLLAAAAAPAQSSSTALRITVWPDGSASGRTSWTLRCEPIGGTLPNRATACRKLAALTKPFAPVPEDAVCTMIYGGPARAVVSGRHAGRRVWATFARNDGCRIGRWNRHAFLLPIATDRA